MVSVKLSQNAPPPQPAHAQAKELIWAPRRVVGNAAPSAGDTFAVPRTSSTPTIQLAEWNFPANEQDMAYPLELKHGIASYSSFQRSRGSFPDFPSLGWKSSRSTPPILGTFRQLVPENGLGITQTCERGRIGLWGTTQQLAKSPPGPGPPASSRSPGPPPLWHLGPSPRSPCLQSSDPPLPPTRGLP